MKLRDIYKQKKIKLNESWANEDENKVGLDEKKAFLEAVGNFNQFGKSVYREANFKTLAEDISKMIEMARHIALKEGDWFDGVTVNRHMKGLRESQKVFDQTCKEMQVLQQRFEAVYEDIGSTLGRYFNINELVDEGNAFGDAVRKAKAAGKDEFEVDGKTYQVKELTKPSTHGYNPSVKDVDKKYAKVKKKSESTRPKQVYNPDDYDKQGNRIKK
jgi:hypothetical protein